MHPNYCYLLKIKICEIKNVKSIFPTRYKKILIELFNTYKNYEIIYTFKKIKKSLVFFKNCLFLKKL